MYLQNILARQAVNTSSTSPVLGVQAVLMPLLNQWGGNVLRKVHPSGSFAKGTANLSGTDIDLFISISSSVTDSLKHIYTTLFNKMSQNGLNPKQQNVYINVRVNGYEVDLVHANHQGGNSEDHSIYRRRADTWTLTNVYTHVATVANSGRTGEIRILKLWRDQNQLDFPSFYLELAVLNALSGARGTISQNVWTALEYIRDNFANERIVDPANTNNIISNDLSAADKGKIVVAATRALQARIWGEVIV